MTTNSQAFHTFLYAHRLYYIPQRMASGITAYLNRDHIPGSFLEAVICNDLRRAVQMADDENMDNLPAYVDFFYNHAPMDCWGSEAKMKAWLGGKD